MPATMQILGWKARGLRCPDHDINCCKPNGEPFKVSLIQMPNGTGKTTTLTLLRAALSGTASEWDPDTVRTFRKKGSAEAEGTFEVSLLLNKSRTTIIMHFDFESGRVQYKTTRDYGQVPRFSPPVQFRRFLDPNFVNFFIFDGELASNLLDKTHTHAELVVENLFFLRLLRDLQSKVEEHWEDRARQVSAKQQKGLSRRRNDLQKLEQQLQQLEARKQELENERARLSESLKRHQGVYDEEIGRIERRNEQLHSAKEDLANLEKDIRQTAQEILNQMKRPHVLSEIFGAMLLQFKNSLDRVKLPESAAREFFEELANEPVCVCGREITDDVREEIRRRAIHYLASDDVSLLNAIKTNIQQSVGLQQNEDAEQLRQELSRLDDLVRRRREAQSAVDEIQREIEQSDPRVMHAKENIERYTTQLEQVEQELEKFSNGTYDLDALRNEIKKARKKLAEITQTLTIRKKCDILKSILADAIERARRDIVAAICDEANQRIRELLPYNNISIHDINHCLVLEGQEGGSVGETLSVAYAFLGTLFCRSEHQLPFVVDSPAGAIDYAVRPRIGELIPHLVTQFIAFTISSERERFVQPLKAAASGDVQFVTLFRKGPAELERIARESGSSVETADGMLVLGEPFFMQFQLDEEASSQE